MEQNGAADGPDEMRSTDETTNETASSLVDLIDWDKVLADGVMTSDEIDAELRAKGLDPEEYDYLYRDGP